MASHSFTNLEWNYLTFRISKVTGRLFVYHNSGPRTGCPANRDQLDRRNQMQQPE